MTKEEFNKHAFGAGDTAKYTDGNIYNIASVDFQEQLIGLLMHIYGSEDPNEITWVRCENIEFISYEWLMGKQALNIMSESIKF